MFENDGNSNFLWLILIFALLFGVGGNGFMSRNGVSDNYVLTSDFANIERKIDGVNNGLCSGFYEQAQLANGTNQIVNNGFASAELSRANMQTALANQLYAMQSAQQECCCQNRYDNLVNSNNVQNAVNNGFCQTNFNAQNNTRDIVDSQNASTQAILAKLSAMESNAKDEKIAELTAKNADLRLQASQVAQNGYLVSQLRPSPIPSYIVSNPYCGNGYYGTTIS